MMKYEEDELKKKRKNSQKENDNSTLPVRRPTSFQ